ncbi:sensor domain-containing diguanylate cyclase [Comamonas jiangduensis]|uniref:sensor domain-containing diguanylate cyclase n=2 Tax=Comamonas jiangduensis TaxID=1194168 RepID=UPI003BF7BF85
MTIIKTEIPFSKLEVLNLLQAAVDQAFNAVLITSPGENGRGHKIIYCNPAFCKMTGYSLEELFGQSPGLLQGPLTDKELLKKLRITLLENKPFLGSALNYRKDGTIYLVEWNISAVRDATGEIQAYVSVQQDITARAEAEHRQALLARALDATEDAVLISDDKAQILFVNQAFEHQTGYSSSEVLGKTPKFLQSGTHTPTFYADLHLALAQGESYQSTFTNKHKDGHLYYAAQTITPIKDENGSIAHFVSVSKDVSDLVMRTHELKKQAEHDALTGLLNRRVGERKLKLCCKTAQSKKQAYALILIDIDNFKKINDQFGHDEGDRVLRQCAKLINSSVRMGDIVTRWGGEEFLIVLPGCPLDAARDLAERIRKVVASQNDPIVGQITLSLGVGTVRLSENYTELLKRTDEALYQAKRSGRNKVVIAETVL